MAKFTTHLIAFNRGLISNLGLARIDLKRTAFSAETYLNWIPRTLGSMMLRPGLAFISSSLNNVKPKYLPFVFSSTDTAIIELTPLKMRVLEITGVAQSGTKVETPISRVSVSTAVTNGDFDTDLTGWTAADELGGVSSWVNGNLQLLGTGVNAASRKQTLTVSAGDAGKVHALTVKVARNSLFLRVGSTNGGDEYISETSLIRGEHSLSFTPAAGSVFIEVFSRTNFPVLLDSINVAPAGDMVITTLWNTADLENVRVVQSADVLFVACKGIPQQRIERRSTTSWSVVDYRADNGPFLPINVGPIRLSTSTLTGSTVVTATKPLFKATNVGSLYKLISVGQTVQFSASGQDQFTSHILVTGVGSARSFSILITGTWVGTIRLQRSVEAPGNWVDYKSFTANTSTSELDGLDNQVIYYRIGFKTGEYTSGTANLTLTFAAGSISGIVKMNDFVSSTVMGGSILKDMGSTSSTDDWEEGAWSTRRGFPTSVTLHEGRLWWCGKDHVWGSVSDAFDLFDSDVKGDSGTISRSIGLGPVDTISWLVAGTRLVIGGQGAEYTAQSSSTDEPLTPTNFNLKVVSTSGSKGVAALNLDQTIVFVQRGGSRVLEMTQRDQYSGYVTADMTSVVPDIGVPGIVNIAVQRQPDTRIHCVRSDGTVAILVYDEDEQVRCWVNFSTDGSVVDVIVLPSDLDKKEDRVYYAIKRTIGGVDKHFLERWAFEDDCQGGLANHQADSYVFYDGSPAATITGLSHLEGKSVVVWADGKDVGLKTVSSGAVTLSVAASKVVVGLGYTANFKTSKLAYNSESGSPLTQRKRVDHIGVILSNTHYKGLKYGRDFNNLDDLPDVKGYETLAADTVFSVYDENSIEFPGIWDTDSRVCLQAAAPRPCTLLALVITMVENDKL